MVERGVVDGALPRPRRRDASSIDENERELTSSLPTLDGNVDDESRSCYDGERTGTSTATTRAVLACGDSELSGNARSELMLRATR